MMKRKSGYKKKRAVKFIALLRRIFIFIPEFLNL